MFANRGFIRWHYSALSGFRGVHGKITSLAKDSSIAWWFISTATFSSFLKYLASESVIFEFMAFSGKPKNSFAINK